MHILCLLKQAVSVVCNKTTYILFNQLYFVRQLIFASTSYILFVKEFFVFVVSIANYACRVCVI